jgi:hypothetical protein
MVKGKQEKEVQRHECIEYFDSLRSEDKRFAAGMLDFKQKASIKVRTDETRYDDFGMINFYGVVSKRRAESSKFHERYMVLRGFDLYWYQKVDSIGQKGISPIPSKPIVQLMVDKKKCFVLEKEDGVKESRRLVF